MYELFIGFKQIIQHLSIITKIIHNFIIHTALYAFGIQYLKLPRIKDSSFFLNLIYQEYHLDISFGVVC